MRSHYGKIIERNGAHKIINCKACGFAHVYSIPSKKTLEEFYGKEFYKKIKPEYINKTKKELDYWKITYRDRLEVFDKYIKRKKRRILDIGCSGDYFLKYFKERRWQVLGIEPSRYAAKYAESRGIDVINKSFEDMPLVELGRFDAINMSFVLEHTAEPIKVCKICYKLLKKGGILCIEVPNDFNPLQQIVKKELKKSSYWIVQPDHINYFTLQSLEMMLNRVGFRSVLKEGSFPMELFLLMGDDYIGNCKVGLRCHKKRMQFEKTLYKAGFNDLRRLLYQMLTRIGIGREIIQYFIKPS